MLGTTIIRYCLSENHVKLMGKMALLSSDLLMQSHHPKRVTVYTKSKDRLKQQLVMMIQNIAVREMKRVRVLMKS